MACARTVKVQSEKTIYPSRFRTVKPNNETIVYSTSVELLTRKLIDGKPARSAAFRRFRSLKAVSEIFSITSTSRTRVAFSLFLSPQNFPQIQPSHGIALAILTPFKTKSARPLLAF
jgi:hypothetical protein